MLDALQLTRMLRGIASGMTYLSEMKYVHRVRNQRQQEIFM